MADNNPKQMYLVTELAAKAEVSRAYIRRLLVEGRIRGEKVGGVWTISKEEGDKFVQTREKP